MAKKKHWREILPSTYIASADLDDGQGGFKAVTVTITDAYEDVLVGDKRPKDECLLLKLQEFDRPMVMNKTNASACETVLGTPYPAEWVGKRMILSVDPKARQFGGGTGPALRFKTYPPKEEAKVIPCESCGEQIKPIRGIAPDIVAEKTKEQYGQALCNACATKAQQNAKAEEPEVEEDLDDSEL